MAKVKVQLDGVLMDGQNVTFKAPCACTEIDGLTVSYVTRENSKYVEHSVDFTFRDAHNTDLTNLGNLFDAGAYVKVILDTNNKYAFIQNADTNGYLESKIPSIQFGNANATYYDASWMKCDVTVGTEYNGKVPVVTLMYVNQTPYLNVKQVLTTPVSGGKFTVWLSGSGFVAGHVLSFAYAVGL